MRKLRILLLLGMPAALSGQAMVEYGLGLAASGTAGAPGQTAGRSIAGIMSNLTQTLNSANHAPAAAAAAVAAVPAKPAAVATEPPKPAVTYADPSGITAGMDRAEMIKRFGPSAMQILSSGGRESFTYEFKDRTVDVEVLNGKVASARTKSKAKQSAVVVIP